MGETENHIQSNLFFGTWNTDFFFRTKWRKCYFTQCAANLWNLFPSGVL